jgi:hypothetical protein
LAKEPTAPRFTAARTMRLRASNTDHDHLGRAPNATSPIISDYCDFFASHIVRHSDLTPRKSPKASHPTRSSFINVAGYEELALSL